MTANQREYSKQIKRIKQAVRRLEKRGYRFSDDVIPQMPKRVTKSAIKRLQEIRTKDLYKQAEYVDQSTGEILTGTEGKQLEKKKSTQKAKETRKRKQKRREQPPRDYEDIYSPPPVEDYPSFSEIVINNYKVHIRQFNDVAYNLLSNWLDRIIATNGIEDTAIMLNEGAENGNVVTYQIVYSNEKLTQYITAMMDYLPEAGDFFKEEMLEAFESMEDWESPV